MTDGMIAALLVDDQKLVRSGLRRILRRKDGISCGSSRFVLKNSPAEELIRAVRPVARGDGFLNPSVTARVLDTYRTSSEEPLSGADELTPRELDVLRLMAKGRSNAEIADELVISGVTVKSHIGRIFLKLRLRDRAAAIGYAYQNGIAVPRLYPPGCGKPLPAQPRHLGKIQQGKGAHHLGEQMVGQLGVTGQAAAVQIGGDDAALYRAVDPVAGPVAHPFRHRGKGARVGSEDRSAAVILETCQRFGQAVEQGRRGHFADGALRLWRRRHVQYAYPVHALSGRRLVPVAEHLNRRTDREHRGAT